MPRELRVTFKAVIPLPDGGAFEEAKRTLLIGTEIEALAQLVRDNGGSCDDTADVVISRVRRADDQPVELELVPAEAA